MFTILRDEATVNQVSSADDDPFRPYLQYLYQRVIAYLKQTVIREIDLNTEITPNAVEGQSTESSSSDMLDLLFSPHDAGAIEETPRVFGSFKDAFDYYDGRVLLLGQPGAGKTITLMSHLRDAIAARLDNATKPLPLFGVIAGWNPQTMLAFPQWLATSYRDLEQSALQSAITNGQTILFLDGLDELGGERFDKTRQESYDPRLRFMNQIPSNNQVLMTCRIGDYKDIGAKVTLKGALTLQPMNDGQISDYLATQPELINAIQGDSQLRTIMETPLLLSLFAFAYTDMTDDERTQLASLANVGDVRDRIFMTYMDKRYVHEQRKHGKLDFSLDDMRKVLGQVAYKNIHNPLASENVLDSADFPDYTAEAFIQQARGMNLLVLGTDGESIRFIHLLMRDTFAYSYSVKQLAQSDPRLRRETITVLTRLGDSRATEKIHTLLNDNSRIEYSPWRTSDNAAQALVELGDMRGIDHFIDALHDNNGWVRRGSAEALGQVGSTDAIPYLKNAIPHLIECLGDRDAGVRVSSAKTLGKLRAEEAVPKLATLINEKSKDLGKQIGAEVRKALVKIGTPQAQKVLSEWNKRQG